MGRFGEALEVVLHFEGGYSDHPDDPGGATMKGVTQRVYHSWLRDQGLPTRPVRSIKQHELEAIYRWRYWGPAHCAELPDPLDIIHMDAAVNTGYRQAIRLLQRAAGSTVDGVWGPMTRAAVDEAPALWLADDALWTRAEFYRDLVRKPREDGRDLAGGHRD